MNPQPPSPPAQHIGDQSEYIIPPSQTEKNWAEKKVKLITSSQEHVKPNRDRLKLKKKNFFDEMISEADKFENSDKKSWDLHPCQDDSDNMEIVEVKPNTGYIFKPLTFEQHTTVCHRTGLIYRKDELNFSNEGENMGTHSPKVRSIKGDGNYFFRAVSVGLMDWEVGHLKIRQMVCKHITTYGTYTRECEGKYYVN